MIVTRHELAELLSAPKVLAVLPAGLQPGELADLLLEARDAKGDPPVGERWDAVEAAYAHQGVRPIGHVGRSPTFSLESHEYILERLRAADTR